jgi:hypothetical protein
MIRVFPLVAIFVFFGCKEVSFKEPQPKGKKALATVPKDLRGKYLTLTEEGKLSKDTVIITASGYRFGYFDPAERSGKNDNYEEGTLGDSLILKSFKGYYFLNVNENPEWLLRVIRQEKNGDLVYMSLEEKNLDFNLYLEKLSREVRIDSMTTPQETLYQIDPTANQLIDLINMGFFSKTSLVKIKQAK